MTYAIAYLIALAIVILFVRGASILNGDNDG
jgi:hypothetical protein